MQPVHTTHIMLYIFTASGLLMCYFSWTPSFYDVRIASSNKIQSKIKNSIIKPSNINCASILRYSDVTQSSSFFPLLFFNLQHAAFYAVWLQHTKSQYIICFQVFYETFVDILLVKGIICLSLLLNYSSNSFLQHQLLVRLSKNSGLWLFICQLALNVLIQIHRVCNKIYLCVPDRIHGDSRKL